MSPTTDRARPHRGLFVTLEGGEGAGKSTLSSALSEALAARGLPVVLTREPGSSSIGPALRAMLLPAERTPLSPRCEALLFAAERAQHVAEVVAPALDAGAIVICDRYVDSSLAYQAGARGLDAHGVRFLSEWGTSGLRPDVTFLLDVDPRVGLARKGEHEVNHMERLDIATHEGIRATFLRLAAEEPDRFDVLDAQAPASALLASCLRKIEQGLTAPDTTG